MLEPHPANPQQPSRLPAQMPHPILDNPKLERVELAKFPPDDDQLPAGPPGGGVPAGGGGGFDPGDGDFKKGRFNPVVIVGAIVAVAVLVGFLFIGFQQEEERLTPEQATKEKKSIYVLPKEEQIPRWRKWAASGQSGLLREEALKQLAWAKDPEGVQLAIEALKAESEPVQGMAASALAEYGLPMAEPAKGPLLQALKEAGPGAKPQIAWALVELEEEKAFDEVLKLYRSGHLSKVQRLGGGLAFDPNKIADMVSLDKLATLADDESAAVRQLVATVLSRHAEPKHTDALINLVQDDDPEVARQAAPGLGRIGDERARKPLLAALKNADKESRKKYLMALRDGIGAKGLVLAIDSINKEDPTKEYYQMKVIFDMLEELADMRAGDPLLQFIHTEPHIHWQTRAAILMGEVGDERAVPTLAKRLRMDPLKIYSDETDWEQRLKRDDNERVVAARMIADLAVLHPDKLDQIRAQAEDAVIFWNHELPAPHANGLRALAAMKSSEDIDALRDWANPDIPLPKEGQQPPFPEEWAIAQSAMRYLGWLKDDKSWDVLEKALTARPEEYDVTMDALYGSGLAMLGMTLRAVGVGAAHGFSQWRDPRAFDPLLDYIEDRKNNEQSRKKACAALAWVAEKDDMTKVAEKIEEYSGDNKGDQFIRGCLLETLIQRPVPGIGPQLMELMTETSALGTRHQVARAVAKSGIDPEMEKKLFAMMDKEALLNDAALALILGGSSDTAARAVAMYADKSKEAVRDLAHLWYDTFGYWSTEDLEKGLIFKWVDNAEAISRIVIHETPQEWAKAQLMAQFDNLDFDNGPHSFTRVVLRNRLYQMAKGKDEAKRADAIETLLFMKEQGALLALRDEPGETGKLARRAYHSLMNPKLLAGGDIPSNEE